MEVAQTQRKRRKISMLSRRAREHLTSDDFSEVTAAKQMEVSNGWEMFTSTTRPFLMYMNT